MNLTSCGGLKVATIVKTEKYDFFTKMKIRASGGAIRDLVFENLVIGDEKIEGKDHFYTNEYVHDLQFS